MAKRLLLAATLIPSLASALALPLPPISKRQSAPAAPTAASNNGFSNVASTSGTLYRRDGGAYGLINGNHMSMWYDTQICDPSNTSNCPFAAFNSLSFATSSPTEVTDPNNGRNLCITNSQTGAQEHVWLGQIVQTSSTQGVAYFLNITAGSDGSEVANNAGAARIDISDLDNPTCSRIADSFWSGANAPFYGTDGAILGSDGFAYLYGTETTGQDIYLARVDPAHVDDLSQYSYYNGFIFGTDPSQAVKVLTANGGTVSYNQHLGGYLYLTNWAGGSIIGFVAPNPWGPWSDSGNLFGDPAGFNYQPNAQPQYDPSGKTLVIQYSAAGATPYLQKTTTITFN